MLSHGDSELIWKISFLLNYWVKLTTHWHLLCLPKAGAFPEFIVKTASDWVQYVHSENWSTVIAHDWYIKRAYNQYLRSGILRHISTGYKTGQCCLNWPKMVICHWLLVLCMGFVPVSVYHVYYEWSLNSDILWVKSYAWYITLWNIMIGSYKWYIMRNIFKWIIIIDISVFKIWGRSCIPSWICVPDLIVIQTAILMWISNPCQSFWIEGFQTLKVFS